MPPAKPEDKDGIAIPGWFVKLPPYITGLVVLLGGGAMYSRVGDINQATSQRLDRLSVQVGELVTSVELLSYRMGQQEEWKVATVRNQEKIDALRDELNALKIKQAEKNGARQ